MDDMVGVVDGLTEEVRGTNHKDTTLLPSPSLPGRQTHWEHLSTVTQVIESEREFQHESSLTSCISSSYEQDCKLYVIFSSLSYVLPDSDREDPVVDPMGLVVPPKQMSSGLGSLMANYGSMSESEDEEGPDG